MKITESQLRKLVESCVKEALEDVEVNEGVLGAAVKSMNQYNRPNQSFVDKKEAKKMITGKPNKKEYEEALTAYNASGDPDEACRAIETKPGFGGKMARTGAMIGNQAHLAGKKIGNMFRKKK
jgi:hypothetical protein